MAMNTDFLSADFPAPVDVEGVDDQSPNRFFNRELSWLAFNERVLTLAADPDLPLLERAKFIAIFASNLDEFFQVRIAALKDQVAADVDAPSPDGRTPLEPMTEYSTGDLVVLVSGSMRMAVEAVDGDNIACVWCNEGEIGRDNFNVKLLNASRQPMFSATQPPSRKASMIPAEIPTV